MGAPEDICPLLLVLLLSLSLSVHLITPSSLPHRTRTHPRSRSTPRRCGATGWWPRRCPRVRVWPPAPAAPPLSAAECLKGAEGEQSVGYQDSLGHFGTEMMSFLDWTWHFPTFSDGLQQHAACVADGRQIGRVVPLCPHVVMRVGGRRGHGSC